MPVACAFLCLPIVRHMDQTPPGAVFRRSGTGLSRATQRQSRPGGGGFHKIPPHLRQQFDKFRMLRVVELARHGFSALAKTTANPLP
jgi:hypothetical protein